jgi:predicted transcriptional regulator
MKKVYVATRLEQQTNDALKSIAEEYDRTVSYLLRKAAEEYAQRYQVGESPRADQP